jgi:hypothetical protein
VSLCSSHDTWADEREAARAAYDRGTRAFDHAEYSVAAAEFARADALEPHPVALKWALLAAVKADDPVLGMTLVDRTARRASDASLAGAASAARQKFQPRVAALVLRCPNGRACQGRVDGAPAAVIESTPAAAAAGTSTPQRIYVLPGTHAVEITVDGRTDRSLVEVAAGATQDVGYGDAPAPSEPQSGAARTGSPSTPVGASASRSEATRERAEQPTRSSARGGLSPVWFWASAGATAVLGAFTIGSGVDTLNEHDAYLATREPGGDEAGRAAQTRTNVLLIVTGSVALATAAMGVFAVDWQHGRRRTGYPRALRLAPAPLPGIRF